MHTCILYTQTIHVMHVYKLRLYCKDVEEDYELVLEKILEIIFKKSNSGITAGINYRRN